MSPHPRWKIIAIFGVAFLAATTGAALMSGQWVLTALPIGFLFGFFLQKGDLCGASAFSESLMFRDHGKIFGLWIAIAVSMGAFALGDVMGLVRLNPKPMIWINFIAGGALFGSGTVLAGGCVSGCLYKSATGNINSIAALIAMPVGIGLVEYGPLKGMLLWMKGHKIAGADGGALSLPGVTGLPFWALALLFVLITAAAVTGYKIKNPWKPEHKQKASITRLLTRSWRPWQAGLAIGIISLFAYMSSAASGRNYPLGVTHGVLQAELLLTDGNLVHVSPPGPGAEQSSAESPPAGGKKIVWWLVLLVGGLMLGSFTSGTMSGQARLLPRPPEQTLVAIAGGVMVGAGAALATGCVIGNILSGWALMSVGTILFGIVVVSANWLTTYVYLMGGNLPPAKREKT